MNHDDEALDPPFLTAMEDIVLLTGFDGDDQVGMLVLARILLRLVDECEALANGRT